MLFHEVYGSYYNVVAGILTEAVRGDLSGARIRKIIEEKAYLESGTAIPKALEKGAWPLIRKNYTTPVRHVPTMPLTLLQKQWMKAICQDPRVRLFDPPLQELEGVEPLFEPDFFVWYDRYADGDPYEEPLYQEHFRLVLLALRERRGLRIGYRGRRFRHNQVYFPERLEYSSKDDKFRLLAHSPSGKPYAIRLASMSEVSLTESPAEAEGSLALQPDISETSMAGSPAEAEGRTDAQPDASETSRAEHPAAAGSGFRPSKETVILELVDERNALERAMIHFSDLEKETVKLDDIHYRITLRYRKDDETEILIRVLSFGPKVKVVAPESFIHLIRERLEMQKRFNVMVQ